MRFKMAHYNLNVKDMDVSLTFYKETLNMKESSRSVPEDGSFIIVYLVDEFNTDFKLELTWLRDHPQAYDLGEEEYHLAFYVEEYDKLKAEHEEKGLICYNTEGKPFHFILDPDGYWIEFFPMRG